MENFPAVNLALVYLYYYHSIVYHHDFRYSFLISPDTNLTASLTHRLYSLFPEHLTALNRQNTSHIASRWKNFIRECARRTVEQKCNAKSTNWGERFLLIAVSAAPWPQASRQVSPKVEVCWFGRRFIGVERENSSRNQEKVFAKTRKAAAASGWLEARSRKKCWQNGPRNQFIEFRNLAPQSRRRVRANPQDWLRNLRGCVQGRWRWW